MGLNYHSKHKNDSESFWTSYSDLFLGLSSIFLLLYVVASLRTGTDGVRNSTENKKLKVEIQDLKNQLATYEAVKENYMKSQANKSEVNEYNELMDKLTLLQEEAKNEHVTTICT
jgi:regulator of replication initiation timing